MNSTDGSQVLDPLTGLNSWSRKGVITDLWPNLGMIASKGMHEHKVLREVTPSGRGVDWGFHIGSLASAPV